MPNNTKDKVAYCGHHPPYTAVCLFRRQAGRPDKGNCLESGGIRVNMLTPRFAFALIAVSCKNGLFFIRILPVGAEVCFAPCHHALQDGDKALAEFSKRIFHFGRDFLINLPVEETVTFQFPELLCERWAEICRQREEAGKAVRAGQ